MNTELIRLARKAAKDFADADGYSQASQLINALCDELEADAVTNSTLTGATLLPKGLAYRVIAKHIFRAHRMHKGEKVLILLADDLGEAEKLAMTAFGTSNVLVRRLAPFADPQIYEV